MMSNPEFRAAIFTALIVGAVAMSAHGQQKVTFDQNVLPLLRDKCINCHGADKAKGGLDMSTYGKLMEGGSSGVVVKPGDADGSRLFTLAAHKEEPKMPPNAAALSKESLDLVRTWIVSGALENAGSKANIPDKKPESMLKVAFHGRPAVPPLPKVALPQQPLVRTSRSNAVTALATSPWAPLVAVASQKQVVLYNTDTLELVGILPFTHGQINVLRFSRNGDLLLAAGGRGGKSGKVVLYDIKTGKITSEIGDETDAILAADLSPDQTMVAVGGPSRIVRVYSTADGSKLREIKKHTEWVTATEFSPDGVLLATGDRNGGLVVWEANTGREYFVLAGHRAAITDMAWRDDGNQLASSSEEGTIKTWEMEEGKQVRSFAAHGGGVQSVKFAHDGRIVTCGRDLRAKVFDGNGGQQREFTGIPDLAMKVAITHDGQRIMAGDWGGNVHVWQTADAKRVGQVNTNPPSPAERLEKAKSELIAKTRVAEIAEGLFKEAQTQEQSLKNAFDGASAAFATAHKAVEANKKNIETTSKQANDAQLRADQSNREVAASQLKINAYAAALKQIQTEAAKTPNDKAVAAAVAEVQKTLTDATATFNRLKTEQQQAAKNAADLKQQLPKVQETFNNGQNQFKTAQDNLAKADQNFKSAGPKTAAAKAVFDRAASDRDAAKALVDQLQKAVEKK